MRRRRNSGFTLLEVMVALAVIGALLVTVIYTLNYHLDVAYRHEASTVATMLGMEKLSEMRADPQSDEGIFDAPYEDYRFVVDVSDSRHPGLSEISVVVSKGEEKVSLREVLIGETFKGVGDVASAK